MAAHRLYAEQRAVCRTSLASIVALARAAAFLPSASISIGSLEFKFGSLPENNQRLLFSFSLLFAGDAQFRRSGDAGRGGQ